MPKMNSACCLLCSRALQTAEVFISRLWLWYPEMSELPYLSSLTWHDAVARGDNFKSGRAHQQHGATYTGRCCSCRYHVNDSGLWPFVFYSLATVRVYQQSASNLLHRRAAVTITSGMRKDSCEWKAWDLPTALSHSAILGASCSPYFI